MSSRWIQLGTLSLLITPGTWLMAQTPKVDRDNGLLPPVVQVMAKEPIEEDEIVVELIKAMPKTREQMKITSNGEFKTIKVKREKMDEPIHMTVTEPGKAADMPVEMKVEKAEKPVDRKAEKHELKTEKVVPVRRDEPLAFLPLEKQQALPVVQTPTQPSPLRPTTPARLPDEHLSKVVKVPVRENAYGDWKMPEMQWPDWMISHTGVPTDSIEFLPPSLSESNVGWIDSALIGNQVRFRYDARWKNPTPDRAEFFVGRSKQYFDGFEISGRGFSVPESNIDMFEGTTYVEYAFTPRLSGFMEMPVRYIRPTENPSAIGGGDFNLGFKLAYFAMPDQVQTFQLRLIFPTGSESRGLGTGHSVIEPSLLLWQKLSQDFTLESELRNWIPVGGLNYSGFTLRYALGLSYDMYRGESISIKPVTELIGWSTLRGLQSDFIDSLPTFQTTSSAVGTVIESAWGVRGTVYGNCDYYAGYSFALTTPTWFEHNLRAELRWRF